MTGIRVSRRDDGFTLIELLAVIAIFGVVVVVLVNAITLGLRSTDQATARMQISHDEELLAARFVPDASGATSVATTASACEADPLVRFGFLDAGVVGEVAYRIDGDAHELVRVRCLGGQRSEAVVAHSLGQTSPGITCRPVCNGTPFQVILSAPLCKRSPAGRCDPATARTITLTATPRGAG